MQTNVMDDQYRVGVIDPPEPMSVDKLLTRINCPAVAAIDHHAVPAPITLTISPRTAPPGAGKLKTIEPEELVAI